MSEAKSTRRHIKMRLMLFVMMLCSLVVVLLVDRVEAGVQYENGTVINSKAIHNRLRLGLRSNLEGRKRKEEARLRTSQAWMLNNFSWLHWWEMHENYFFPDDQNKINYESPEVKAVRKEYINEMRAIMRTPDLEMKRHAILVIGELGLKEMKVDLIKMLKASDLVARKHAWIALGMIDESVVTTFTVDVEAMEERPRDELRDISLTKEQRDIEAVQILALALKKELSDEEIRFLYEKAEELDRRKQRANDALESLLFVLRVHKPALTQKIMRAVLTNAVHPYVANQAIMCLGENQDNEMENILLATMENRKTGKKIVPAVKKLRGLSDMNPGVAGKSYGAAASGLEIACILSLMKYANDEGRSNRNAETVEETYHQRISVYKEVFDFNNKIKKSPWRSRTNKRSPYAKDVISKENFVMSDLNWLTHYGSYSLEMWNGSEFEDRVRYYRSDKLAAKQRMEQGPEQRFGLIMLGVTGSENFMDTLNSILDMDYQFMAGDLDTMKEDPGRGCAAIGLGLYMRRKMNTETRRRGMNDSAQVRKALRNFENIFIDDQESEQIKVASALALGLSQNPQGIKILREEAVRSYSVLELAFIAQSLAMLGDAEGSHELNKALAQLIFQVDANGAHVEDFEMTKQQKHHMFMSNHKRRLVVKTMLMTAARYDMDEEEHAEFWTTILKLAFFADPALDIKLVRAVKMMNDFEVAMMLNSSITDLLEIREFSAQASLEFDMDEPYGVLRNNFLLMNAMLTPKLETKWRVLVRGMNFAMPNEGKNKQTRDKMGVLNTSTLHQFRCYADRYFMMAIMRPREDHDFWY
ncbi:hypothetical protein JD969_12160 [Planctomycetota bacterium]|nr:hypothetical protein JD969_12160 [Planctomycetota bacterium]